MRRIAVIEFDDNEVILPVGVKIEYVTESSRGRLPWRTLAIGESFIIAKDQSRASAMASQAGDRTGHRFATHTITPFIHRITRIS